MSGSWQVKIVLLAGWQGMEWEAEMFPEKGIGETQQPRIIFRNAVNIHIYLGHIKRDC